jgi:hypothetical protein
MAPSARFPQDVGPRDDDRLRQRRDLDRLHDALPRGRPQVHPRRPHPRRRQAPPIPRPHRRLRADRIEGRVPGRDAQALRVRRPTPRAPPRHPQRHVRPHVRHHRAGPSNSARTSGAPWRSRSPRARRPTSTRVARRGGSRRSSPARSACARTAFTGTPAFSARDPPGRFAGRRRGTAPHDAALRVRHAPATSRTACTASLRKYLGRMTGRAPCSSFDPRRHRPADASYDSGGRAPTTRCSTTSACAATSVRWLEQRLDALGGRPRVLDIGCGNGCAARSGSRRGSPRAWASTHRRAMVERARAGAAPGCQHVQHRRGSRARTMPRRRRQHRSSRFPYSRFATSTGTH